MKKLEIITNKIIATPCTFRSGLIHGEKAPLSNLTINWTNGINTNLSKTLEKGKFLSETLNAPVHYLHNPNKKMPVHLMNCAKYKLGFSKAQEVLALVSHLKGLLRDNKSSILHICHSQGAALTKLAATHLAPEEKARIHVRSFGGMSPIEASDGFSSYKNYICQNDRLIKLVNHKARNASSYPGDYIVLDSGKDAVHAHKFKPETPYGNALEKLLLSEIDQLS